MSLVSQHLSDNNTNSLLSSTEFDDTRDESTNSFTEAALSKLLGVSTNSSRRSMDRGATQYSQSGLHSPFQHAFNDAQSEEESADHASAAHYTPEVRSNNYSTSATPTSEYGIYPTSARSGSFPEHIQRQYHPSSNHSGSNGGGMAQPTSPSLPLQDGRNHHNTQIKSDQDVPIDPSIAASSPTYPQHNGQYSPYPQQGDMSHGYPQHPAGGAMYTQPRPDWAGYAGGQHPMHGGYPVSGAQTPTSAAPAGARPGQQLSQVYSFVPIPGAQQHKRPRRRYEEIERMYKCGWNGCEKAYGTLNHLNAHVTMQSHGQKRTPEEFKEIRKEWKARKKEEENQRKAEDERARATVVPADGQNSSDNTPAGYQQPGRSVQLPPIGYQPGAQVPGQYQAPSGGVQQLQGYGGENHLQYSGYPASPYGAPNQMYNQHNGGPAPKYEH
ncbi:hypothetical protein IFR04_009019 [Cadophora malorum]|uniref:C2H2-type domain-containing protein n=1 Tax=Cadophora malorum TaxID=108018 RepID=A0A8H7W779_9HELO|nr:hypothetical protein IFR04_009019 [Cadophora malorum]